LGFPSIFLEKSKLNKKNIYKIMNDNLKTKIKNVAQFARFAGVSKPTVYNFFKGESQNPKVEAALRELEDISDPRVFIRGADTILGENWKSTFQSELSIPIPSGLLGRFGPKVITVNQGDFTNGQLSLLNSEVYEVEYLGEDDEEDLPVIFLPQAKTLEPSGGRVSITLRFSREYLAQADQKTQTDFLQGLVKSLLVAAERRLLKRISENENLMVDGYGVEDPKAVPDYQVVLDLEEFFYGDLSGPNIGYVTTKQIRKVLQKSVKAENGQTVWNGLFCNGIPGIGIDSCPSILGLLEDQHAMILGDWSQAVFAFFGPVEIIQDPYGSQLTKGTIEITATGIIDANIRTEKGFVVASNLVSSLGS
jgi:hypothetical protein